MPTYEYTCKACGEHLEVVQSFKDDPLTTCPNCGGQLRKVFGNIGISFKGSGFYKNDSRTGSGSSRPKSDSTASGDSATKTDTATKSDSGSSSDSGTKSDSGGASSSGGSSSGSATPSAAAS